MKIQLQITVECDEHNAELFETELTEKVEEVVEQVCEDYGAQHRHTRAIPLK
jgi:hypothetical protein